MRLFYFIILLNLYTLSSAQHTFSIVAVDSTTGEIGSAGATCGDSIVWPGTKGALIISDVIPGVGAIHTQSFYILENQLNANNRMDMGDSPQEIIDWLVKNDEYGTPQARQYGIVDFNGGHPRSAGFTGSNCFDYKNHILGVNYAIQGNILLGQQILDSMEARFLRTKGCLSDKLMAAMQGANIIGADSRCTSEGTSSLSAFLRVAKPNNHPDSLFIDLNVAGTPLGVEPINVLQSRYDAWKINNPNDCSMVLKTVKNVKPQMPLFYPNPSSGDINIINPTSEMQKVQIIDNMGKIVFSEELVGFRDEIKLSLQNLNPGTYQVVLQDNNKMIQRSKLILMFK